MTALIPSTDELRHAFDAVLELISPQIDSLLTRNTPDAAYNAYVFSLLLRAVEKVADPGSIRLKSIGGLRGTFVMRGSPGYLHSTHRDYGFAEFRYMDEVYEIHLCTFYYGSSRALHEFDLSILRSTDANKSRQSRKAPGPSKPKVALESKFYGSDLDIGVGRELVGLVADFSGLPTVPRLVTNSGSLSMGRYFSKKNRPKFDSRLIPSNRDKETEFVNAVSDELRQRLR